MPNVFTVYFIPCSPAPANGYRLTWRVAGSSDPYTDEGFFTESPIVIVDPVNPEGTCVEGFLQSDCSESGESGSLVGNAIPWATDCEEESGAEDPYVYYLADEYSCSDGCSDPVREDILVRILSSELPIAFGKWYQDSPYSGLVYQLFGDQQPAASSVLLSGIKTTLCPGCP